MTTTTSAAKLLRAPQSDEKLSSVALHIEHLRDDIEKAIQGGQATVPITAAATAASVAVVFPYAFPAGSTVVVVLGYNGTSVASQVTVSAAAITNTGFTMYGIRQTGTSSVPVSWIAMRVA